MVKYHLILFLFIALFHSTSFSYDENQNKIPDWVENPTIGAVGSSPMHVMGRHAQEELAISRARTRLAATLGVNITSKQTIRERVKNDGLSIQSQKDTSQTLTHKNFKTSVKAIWHDQTRDIIYAWVVPLN